KARRQLRRRWSFSAARRGSRENKSRIISRAVDNARENPYDVLSTSVKGLLKTESTATRPRLSLPCEIRLNGKPTRACYNARSAPFSSSFQGQRHQPFLLEEENMGNKLYVGGLPYSVTEGKLEEVFAPHGTVASARLIADKFTGQSRGFGF